MSRNRLKCWVPPKKMFFVWNGKCSPLFPLHVCVAGYKTRVHVFPCSKTLYNIPDRPGTTGYEMQVHVSPI